MFDPFEIDLDQEAYCIVNNLLYRSYWGGYIKVEYDNFCGIHDLHTSPWSTPALYIPFRIKYTSFKIK